MYPYDKIKKFFKNYLLKGYNMISKDFFNNVDHNKKIKV
jgi:hypothetical protein